MKKNIILIKAFCFISFIFFQINLNAQQNKVKYNINGKIFNYYALSRDSMTHVSVKGPGKLTITTRTRFTSESPDSLTYSIVYVCDDKKLKVHKVKKAGREGTKVSILSSADIPSTPKTFTIKVDPEIHDYSFVMLDKSPQVDLIYKFVPDVTTPKWKDLPPLNDTSKVKIKVDTTNIQSYYKLSSTHAQKFKIKGPTSLRVFTRLEYNYNMQGSLSYRVRVKRNDTIIGTYKLSTKPSIDAQFINNKKLIPGTLEKFYLDVPKGDNNYEFILLDKHFNSLIRISSQKK
jgi:hypothetical protein